MSVEDFLGFVCGVLGDTPFAAPPDDGVYKVSEPMIVKNSGKRILVIGAGHICPAEVSIRTGAVFLPEPRAGFLPEEFPSKFDFESMWGEVNEGEPREFWGFDDQRGRQGFVLREHSFDIMPNIYESPVIKKSRHIIPKRKYRAPSKILPRGNYYLGKGYKIADYNLPRRLA